MPKHLRLLWVLYNMAGQNKQRNTWIDSLPYGQRVTIKQYQEGQLLRRVTAGLPDGHGVSVGSTFTDPFNKNVGDGSKIQDLAIRAATFLGVSRKPGAMATSIFYEGPEPTEISFELNFESFYSARDEVMIPVMNLMMMAVGREHGIEELKGRWPFYDQMMNSINDVSESLTDRIGIIKGPEICKVRMGKTTVFDRCYVSSVAPTFSNVLDNQFLPVAATCSITVKLERNPTQESVAAMFRQSFGEY